MTGHVTGAVRRAGGFTRIVLVTAMIAALFVLAPPADALDVPGEVDFLIGTSTAPEGTPVHTVFVELTIVGAGNTLESNFSVDVDVSVGSPGSADNPEDYTYTETHTVSFTAGDVDGTTGFVAIDIVDDSLDEAEPGDTINLELANPVGTSAIGTAIPTHTVTIADNDLPPEISVSDDTVTEGASAGFDVTLSAQSGQDVSVDYATASGSASTSDYTSESGTLVFAAGETSKTVTVATTPDTIDEGVSEAFTVVLSAPSVVNATILDGTAIGTITDNDTATLSVSDESANEGNPMTFDITLSTQSSSNVNVSYATANGSATAGSDYNAVGLTPVTFLPTETVKTVTVTTIEDSIDEGPEAFTLSLTAASVPVLGGPGTGTINDDDNAGVIVSPTSVSVVEGGATDSYDIVLATPPLAPVAVNVGAGSQVGVSALVPFTSGNWSSPQIVTVTATDDAVVEGSHGLTIDHSVTSSDPAYSSITPSSVSVTIVDNDFSVAFVESASSQLEGDVTTTADVDVVLETNGRTLSSAATVQVVVVAGGDATPGSDYTFTSPTVVTFPGGSLDGTVLPATISVVGDSLNEATETVVLGLQSPSANGSIGTPATHTHSILDNDGPPGFSAVDAPSAAEASGSLVFPIVLSAAPGQIVTVDYATADGTATVADGDYTPVSGTLTFVEGGPMTQDVIVPIVDDSDDEIGETVVLNLPASTVAAIVDNQAIGTILDVLGDDNDAPTVSIQITDQNGTPGIEFGTGETVRLSATFVDDGSADTHTVTVDWGDNSPADTFVLSPVGARAFERTHVYLDAGFETISLTVADADGGSGAKNGFVNIVTSTGGSGSHRVGLVDPTRGKWFLYNNSGDLDTSFYFGDPGDYPFVGDWDGDGIETPGLYRQSDGYVYLRNSNTQGIADIKFFFGNPGDVPVAGDFNGDGFDTVSIYRPSNQTFYIINKLGSGDQGLGAADFSYVFGDPGDKPFVGDFDGDGIETVGLHRESTGLVYFRNSHTQGNADAQFIFGDPGDRLVAGDWTGDGVFSPALFRPSNNTVYFRYTNTQGNADNEWSRGRSSWLPVAGVTGF